MISELTEICHTQGIYLIIADTFGLYSRVFCDFREKFITLDPDGEPE